MKTVIRNVSMMLSMVCLVTLSLSVYSETVQVAKVGAYDESGQIQLFQDRFLKEFPDGTPVKEVIARSLDGYIHLSRKGFSWDKTCRTELIQLVDAMGTPLVQGSDPVEGRSVFIHSAYATKIMDCIDDGCHALKNVHLPGEPKPRRAACDRTEVSDNKCACHIDRGYGDELVRDGKFCRSYFEMVTSNLPTWVHASTIETIPE